MTDRDDGHRFSEGQGYSDPYREFDLDPPELTVDTTKVDPVDSRVLPDMLDESAFPTEGIDAEALIDVGLNYVGINRHEQATETFERAARFAEDERTEREAWVNKGVAHAELEEWDAAIGAYREALRVEADGDMAAVAETNLAYALWESGDTANALEHAERAVELDDRLAQAWYNRGFFLLERGLSEDALNCFDNATRLGMRSAELLEEKARALEEVGEYDRAEEVLEEAEALRDAQERRMIE